jgi:hypothetical protein
MPVPETDAFYVVGVHADGTVIASRVSPLALEVATCGRSALAYRGDGRSDRIAAARDAIGILVASDHPAQPKAET